MVFDRELADAQKSAIASRLEEAVFRSLDIHLHEIHRLNFMPGEEFVEREDRNGRGFCGRFGHLRAQGGVLLRVEVQGRFSGCPPYRHLIHRYRRRAREAWEAWHRFCPDHLRAVSLRNPQREAPVAHAQIYYKGGPPEGVGEKGMLFDAVDPDHGRRARSSGQLSIGQHTQGCRAHPETGFTRFVPRLYTPATSHLESQTRLSALLRRIHHYAHAVALRAELISELHRASKRGHGISTRLPLRVLGAPSMHEAVVRLHRFSSPGTPVLLIDVGAHTGEWTKIFLDSFPHARVVAFEPVRANYEVLERRFGTDPRVAIHHAGLSNKATDLNVAVTSDTRYTSVHRYIPEHAEPRVHPAERESIALRPLDQFHLEPEPGRLTVLKIDVQGHELEVLAGASETLALVDVAIVECSIIPQYNGMPPSYSGVVRTLAEHQLHPAMEFDYGRHRGPYAWEQDVVFASESLLPQLWEWE